jgi:hypothetical protein
MGARGGFEGRKAIGFEASEGVGCKAPTDEKTSLFGPGLEGIGGQAKAPSPDLLRPCELRGLGGLEGFLRALLRNPVLSQLHGQAGRTVALTTDSNECLCETCIGQKAFFNELIEHSLEGLFGFGVRGELSRQLLTTVFSTGQGRNGPGLEAANSRHLNPNRATTT